MYPNHSELLNKRSELVSKCRHENKFLRQTFNSNDSRKYSYIFPDVLESIKKNVFIFQHKNILVK